MMVATPEFEILSKYFYIFVPDRPQGLSIFVFLARPCPAEPFSRSSAPGVPFSAPPVPKSLPNRARCPVFSTTCPEIPAEPCSVSHFLHHLAKGGGGFGGELEQREVNMRRAVKMRKAGGGIDSDAGK